MTWFWIPDTTTLLQWPVITTLLVIPLTLTVPPLQAMVRVSLIPETVMFSPAGALVTEVGGVGAATADVLGTAADAVGLIEEKLGAERDGGQAASDLVRAEGEDRNRQSDHAKHEQRQQDPETSALSPGPYRRALKRATVRQRRRWRHRGTGRRRPFAGRWSRRGFGSASSVGQRLLQFPNTGFWIILGFHLSMLAYQEHG